MSTKEDLAKLFEQKYKELNKEQKLAVDTIDGPVMVIAGPGTGKTSILTLRIAHILQKTDTPPSGILAITYTDAGVKAMRTKLQKIIGNRAHEVRIHTFHGFASSVIAEHPDHFIHIKDAKQMTAIEQDTLIREIISQKEFGDIRPAGKPDAYLSAILRAIDEAKREALTPDKVEDFALREIERIKSDDEHISTRGATKGQLKAEARDLIAKCEKTVLFAKVYERYEEAKRKSGRIDFNDLIIELLAALKNDEVLLRLIQEQFLYIHVDEHQDTNDAQNFIVALIAEFFDTPNIFIVGDEKQAIYRFQGASVENFLLMQKRWPSMKIVSLATNYRSHQSILDASYGMIEKNYKEDEHQNLRIKLKSGSSDKAKPIDIVSAGNSLAADDFLISELRKTAGASTAIIVRRNRDLDRVIRLLEAHDIEVSSERSVDIFSHPVGMLFFDLIEFITDRSRYDLFGKTLAVGMWGLSFAQSTELIRALRSGQTNDAEKSIPALKLIERALVSTGPIGFLTEIASLSGYVQTIARDPSHMFVWRGIIALAESLAREKGIHDPATLVREMLAYRTSAETSMVKVSVGAPDAPIQALTAHGSKGLEFDYVFLPYSTEEAWFGRNRGSSFVLPKKRADDSNVEDVRRLFYVAITRARRHVVIMHAEQESDGKVLTPLRFIDELDAEHVSHTTLPRKELSIEHLLPDKARQGERGSENGQRFVELAKKILTESGLSVTALNHFLKCRNAFLFQSILKLPQAPSIPSEKGNAMHAAISAVWTAEDRTLDDIQDILSSEVQKFFAQSLLSIREKEIAQSDLLEDIPAVAKALQGHFSVGSAAKPGDVAVFTEHWVKSTHTGAYKGKVVEIPIHGKLDAIIDRGEQVQVFDYKTKQAMSVGEIKGETKNSDGGYFRQLVFYRLLLESDHRWKTKEIIPALVFVSPDEKGRCPSISLPIEKKDVIDVSNAIDALIESVWSGKVIGSKCDDTECEWCGMSELLGV